MMMTFVKFKTGAGTVIILNVARINGIIRRGTDAWEVYFSSRRYVEMTDSQVQALQLVISSGQGGVFDLDK